jgi:DNA repair protein RadC
MKLLADEMLFAGTLHEIATSPRDILKRALELNASGLIVAHNHPSGSPEPSKPDETFTMMLVQAAVALGVDVHDHVIVGAESHYSFRGGGKM